MRNVQQAQTPSATVSADEFRRQMGRFATGVCVVSVPCEDGAIAAMTVNSLVSVSLDPMLVCWSLQNSASQFDLYAGAELFGVSILARDQEQLAQRYAARGGSELDPADFMRGPAGTPVISSGLGYMECRKWSDFLAGDHTMLFGEVIGLQSREELGTADNPLGFFKGKFCSINEQ